MQATVTDHDSAASGLSNPTDVQDDAFINLAGGNPEYNAQWYPVMVDGAYLQWDFGSTAAVCHVRLYWYALNAEGYDVHVSDAADFLTSTLVYTVRGLTPKITPVEADWRACQAAGNCRTALDTNAIEDFFLAEVTGRYLRITFTEGAAVGRRTTSWPRWTHAQHRRPGGACERLPHGVRSVRIPTRPTSQAVSGGCKSASRWWTTNSTTTPARPTALLIARKPCKPTLRIRAPTMASIASRGRAYR